MPLTTLIDPAGNAGLAVRDRLGLILLTETAAQMNLATANPALDPEQWRVRVFVDRTNIWDEYGHAPARGTEQASPIVNISWQSAQVDTQTSPIVDYDQRESVFFLDCYGYGISRGDGDGHVAADYLAGNEAARCAFLVQQWLSAAEHYDLGFDPGQVYKKLISETELQFELESDTATKVRARRVTYHVKHTQAFTAITPSTINSMTLDLVRADNGQLLLRVELPED